VRYRTVGTHPARYKEPCKQSFRFYAECAANAQRNGPYRLAAIRLKIAKLVGDPLASANKQTQQYLDQFTKAISDGRDAAAASVKDFMANVSPGASGPQPANKEKVV
jgi:hypothetical protein